MTDTTLQQNVITALERLKDLGAQRQQKMDVVKQLSAAGDPERDIRSQIAALDKTEAEAMDKWAAAAAKGNPPALDHEKRESLNRQLADSQAQTAAAQKAAQKVQEQIVELNKQGDAALATHKVESLAYLTSFAEELGEEYRQARIQVERSRTMLVALDRLLAQAQTLSDPRTTAFLPKVAPHIQQRDLCIEKVQAEAMEAAGEHWRQLWAKCMRGDFSE